MYRFALEKNRKKSLSVNKKEIYRWIQRSYGRNHWEMSEKVSKYFLSAKNCGEILHFLQECSLQVENSEKEYFRKIEELTSAFTPETAEALQELVLSPFWQAVSRKGDRVEFLLGEEEAVLRRLTLYDTEGIIPDSNQFLYGSVELSEEDGRFWLRGEVQNAESESAKVELSFLRADVQAKSCRITAEWGCFETPWSCLQSLGASLMEKDRIAGYACNEEEKALLPLMREIVSLDAVLEEKDWVKKFPELKELAQKYGKDNVAELLDEIEKTLPDISSCQKLLDKLFFILNGIECEPLWREIFNQIEQSQKAYPDRVPCCVPENLWRKAGRTYRVRWKLWGIAGNIPIFIERVPYKEFGWSAPVERHIGLALKRGRFF